MGGLEEDGLPVGEHSANTDDLSAAPVEGQVLVGDDPSVFGSAHVAKRRISLLSGINPRTEG
ncbi:hypothetical protein ACWCOW_37900 [Streptomyces sp. NPDC001939]